MKKIIKIRGNVVAILILTIAIAMVGISQAREIITRENTYSAKYIDANGTWRSLDQIKDYKAYLYTNYGDRIELWRRGVTLVQHKLPWVDRYIVNFNDFSIKVTLVLNNKPAKIPDYLQYRISSSSTVFQTLKKLYVGDFISKDFIAWDSNHSVCYDIVQSVVYANGNLTIFVNKTWLQNATYPVYIDPSWEIDSGEWSECTLDNTTTDKGGDGYIRIGSFFDSFNSSSSQSNYIVTGDNYYTQPYTEVTNTTIRMWNPTSADTASVWISSNIWKYGNVTFRANYSALIANSRFIWGLRNDTVNDWIWHYPFGTSYRTQLSVDSLAYDNTTVISTPPSANVYHNYRIEWNSDAVKWYSDETLLLTNNTASYIPSNPLSLYISQTTASTAPASINYLNVDWAQYRALGVTSGNLTTPIRDAGDYKWYYAKWIGTSDYNNKVNLWGNASSDNSTWSGWVLIRTNATSGTNYTVPSSLQLQYYQLRAELVTYNQLTPEIQSLNNTEYYVPPLNPTNLANTTGNFWINWTWTNPTDENWNATQIYINDTFITNTTDNWYNATYTQHAVKNASLRAEGLGGELNASWVNMTTMIPNNNPTAINITFNDTSVSLNDYIRAWANASDLDVVDTFNYDFVVLYPNGTVYSDPDWSSNNFVDYQHDTSGSFSVYMRARDNNSGLSSATYLVNGSYYTILNQTSVGNTQPTKPYLVNPNINVSGTFYNHSRVLEVKNGTDADDDPVMTHVSINSSLYSRIGDLLSNATSSINSSYTNNSMTANWNTTYYLTMWTTDNNGGDSGDNTTLIYYNESLPSISLSIPTDTQGLSIGDIVFQWTATDSDSDSLTYTWFFSTDVLFETGFREANCSSTNNTTQSISNLGNVFWRVRVNDSIYTVNSSVRSISMSSGSGGGGGGGGGITIIQEAEPLKLDVTEIDTYFIVTGNESRAWEYYLKSNRVLKSVQMVNVSENWKAELLTEGLVKITYKCTDDTKLYRNVMQKVSVTDQQGLVSSVKILLRVINLNYAIQGIQLVYFTFILGFLVAGIKMDKIVYSRKVFGVDVKVPTVGYILFSLLMFLAVTMLLIVISQVSGVV